MRKLFSVYDSKAKMYWSPFTSDSTGSGLRQWEMMVNNEHLEILYKYPADHTLFEIGEFDPSVGVIKPYVEFVNLGLAVGVKRQPQGMLPVEEAIDIAKAKRS